MNLKSNKGKADLKKRTENGKKAEQSKAKK
jgi:hypothetical protein